MTRRPKTSPGKFGDDKTLISWEQIAGAIFHDPEFRKTLPDELKDVSLEEFIEMCPVKCDIIESGEWREI